MPYTPPSQQSPASSKSASPNVSRKSSYSEEVPRSPVAGRPQPPRSSHSTSYLHKHRRSPSITTSDGAPPTPTESTAPGIHTLDFARSSSVRQSPPPINGLVIPTGAVISPPDSSENSDGDESAVDSRGRALASNWVQLKEAVRAIDQRRESSPDKNGVIQLGILMSEPVSQTVSPTALTIEARKIAHSRSSTETAIMMIPRNISFESTTEPSDDSDEEDGLLVKPSLVRKKSGELVKPALRPSSRRRYSSMPGTPTYSKSVHFNDNDNQTRHFLQVDKPIAVSAGTSPIETYAGEPEYPFDESKRQREIKLANFPLSTYDRSARPVRVERLILSADRQTLIGTVAVQNISFQKLVAARFTLDYWKTTSEIVAEYSGDQQRTGLSDGCDRFTFYVKLSDQANIDNKTLFLCVRYNVGGQEFWDNNDDINYQVDFIKAAPKSEQPAPPAGLGARPLNAIPRSRHSPSRRHESMDDDFASRIDSNSAYAFGSSDNLLGESNGSVKLRPKRGRGSLFASNNEPSPGLGGRYDFGASLSAALSTAQDKLGRHSGLMQHNEPKSPSAAITDSYFGPLDRKEGPAKAEERPDDLSTDRPAMGSDQYKDLVQKFCYFTPSAKKAAGSPPTTGSEDSPPSESTNVADEVSKEGAQEESAAARQANVVFTLSRSQSELSIPSQGSYFSSRPASPGRVKSPGYADRAASPISFGYPFHHHNSRDGYLSDSSITPTAILG